MCDKIGVWERVLPFIKLPSETLFPWKLSVQKLRNITSGTVFCAVISKTALSLCLIRRESFFI